MASQITTSLQSVSLLSANTSQSASGTRARDAAQFGFSDMLRGQMSSMNSASKQEQTPAAARQQDQRPERSEAKTSQTDGNQQAEARQNTSASESQNDARNDSADDSSQAADSAASKKAASSAADTPTDAEKAAANEAAAADQAVAGLPADQAVPVAGLPAEIAALLPTAALKQSGSNLSLTDTPIEGDFEGPLATNISLTGDTKGKPLQNPADSQPALRSDAAQPDQIGKIAVPFQLKPELQTSFAERAATSLQTVSAGVPDGSQHSFMHALRQPGHLASTTPQLPVTTPAGQSAWAEEVGNRVMWMVGRAESKAELVLTPPSLGKVEVSINLNGDQTTAQFVAATQSARDALEQAMPRLREILAQSGISLGQADVSTSGEQQASGEGNGRRGGRGSEDGGMDAGAGVGASQWTKQTVGLVDTFA